MVLVFQWLEFPSSLHLAPPHLRWICDLAAVHFINDEEGTFAGSGLLRDSLPEEVRRNTVAMELVCSDRAFCEGLKKDRHRFLNFLAEIGNYLELMSSYTAAPFSPHLNFPHPSLSPFSSSASGSVEPWSLGLKGGGGGSKKERVGMLQRTAGPVSDEDEDESGGEIATYSPCSGSGSGSGSPYGSTGGGEGDGVSPLSPSSSPSLVPASSQLTFRLKKTLAAISAVKFLPRTHRLRVGLENGAPSSFVGAFNAVQRQEEEKKREGGGMGMGMGMVARGLQTKEGDDETLFFASASSRKRLRTQSRSSQSSNFAMGRSKFSGKVAVDDDLWADQTPGKGVGGGGQARRGRQKQDGRPNVKEREDNSEPSNVDVDVTFKSLRSETSVSGVGIGGGYSLASDVDECLLRVLAEILQVEEAVLQQAAGGPGHWLARPLRGDSLWALG